MEEEKLSKLKMSSPLIRLGVKMKTWLGRIIKRDFGEVSYAKGLYNILYLYEKYVPEIEKKKLNGGRRLPYKKWT